MAQDITYPSIVLSKVSHEVTIENLPSSIDTVNLIIKSSNWQKTFYGIVENSSAKIVFSLPESGEYKCFVYETGFTEKIIKAYPGWISIIPPLIAILLALLLRQVVVALFLGIYVGQLFLYNFNPFTALLRLVDTNLFQVLIDPDHMYIIMFTLLIGGVVGVISKNGGTIGLANKITKFAKTERSGMLSSWFMGLIIFFDDYANSLIIGNMMRPITDKLKISREKLAYIVDSTSAPIASLVIISTWIGYEIGLIGEGLRAINSELNPYDLFLQSIPYRFYPLAAIGFVFLISLTGRDFGEMYKAEIKSRNKQGDSEEVETAANKKELKITNAKWYNGAVPILIILFGTILGLFYTGRNALEELGIKNYGIDEIIKFSDSYKALLWSSLTACIVAIILTVSQRILKLDKAVKAWQSGVQSMLVAVIILVLAWGISSITLEFKTADYIILLLSDKISAYLLPAIVFIASGAISFATGTSWGTMAIVMPIVIPMAADISMHDGLSMTQAHLILISTISSVLAGSVWGDHCSPIADTTILSSMSSKCDHISHVKTQLPYAILVGVVTLLIGSIPTAYGLNPYIANIIIIGVLVGILFLIGKKVITD